MPGPSIVTLSCHPRSINSHFVTHRHQLDTIRTHGQTQTIGQTLVSQLSSVNPALVVNLNTLLLFLLCKYYSVRFYWLSQFFKILNCFYQQLLCTDNCKNKYKWTLYSCSNFASIVCLQITLILQVEKKAINTLYPYTEP